MAITKERQHQSARRSTARPGAGEASSIGQPDSLRAAPAAEEFAIGCCPDDDFEAFWLQLLKGDGDGNPLHSVKLIAPREEIVQMLRSLAEESTRNYVKFLSGGAR